MTDGNLVPVWELVSRCPVCGSLDIYELPAQKGVYRLPELETVYFWCNECSVEFQNPRLENINEFYKNGHYRRMLQQSLMRVSDEQRRRALTVVPFIRQRLQSAYSLLDFGSATGDLIDVVCQAYSAQGRGVEMDAQLAEYANAKGRNTADQIVGTGYDLVTIIHTLEHLPYPTLTLCNLRKAMSTGGHIYIEVPKGTYVDSHVISFSANSLKRCAELAGFAVLEEIERDGDLIIWGRNK